MNDRILQSVDDVHRLLSIIPADAPIELAVICGSRMIQVVLSG
jgi:hypothetical protein